MGATVKKAGASRDERRRSARSQQRLKLKDRNRGGARKGAGRKPKGPRPLGDRRAVPHRTRPHFARRYPVHVTIRVMSHVWNLRSRRSFRIVSAALQGVLRKVGALPTHYSVQGNHIHLILEVEGRAHLTRTMRSFNNRLAKGLNVMMRRRGRVIADRYHVVVLRNPTQTHAVIRYVLSNTRKHALEYGRPVPRRLADPYAAGPLEHVPPMMRLDASPNVVEPRTWLLRTGWSQAKGRLLPSHAAMSMG